MSKLNSRRKASSSAASSVAGNEDGHKEAENLVSASKGKYSGLKINKKPRTEPSDAKDKGGFTLNTAPPLTADEINVHRPKPVQQTATEDINLFELFI